MLIFPLRCVTNPQSTLARWTRVANWVLLMLAALALFSPVDVRFRSKGLTGVHFLPITYLSARLSDEELRKAQVDAGSLIDSVDAHTHVVTHGPPLLNRAYYSLVIELP